jgi:hypothetical protein
MNFSAILTNHVLITALVADLVAQLLKVPTHYLRTHQWNWASLVAAGGMPSSHSALITATAWSTGLIYGFGSGIFAVAVAIAMITVYDATGVRRQAGLHARKINILVDELLKGHPINDEQLREVIGHTPLEAISGVLLGIVVAQLMWIFWK